jgi:hypothetical protein
LWLTVFCVLVQKSLRPVARFVYPNKLRRKVLSIIYINTCAF